MPDFDEIALAKLAREMAMNVRKPADVFADFSIDETQFYDIQKIDFYKRAFEQFSIEWNAAGSATDRVKVISASYLEQVLPVIAAKAMSREENLGAATDVAKLLAKNAGIGEGKGDGMAGSDRFVITINLGADTEGKPVIEKFDKSVAIDANDVGGYGTGQTVEQTGAQTPANGAQTAQLALSPEGRSPAPHETVRPEVSTGFFDGIDQ